MFDTREEYLTEAANLILDDLLMPIVEESNWDYERPQFRISVGFPKHTRGGKAIAVCHVREASSDHVNEIFISPEIDDPIIVMQSLVHELIHAIDDCASGHRNFFAHVARKSGLEGPLTKTVAGAKLGSDLESYSQLLGAFPHHRMVLNTRKKATTRQLKVQCSACDFLFRASAKQIDRLLIGHAPCPCCETRGSLEVHL